MTKWEDKREELIDLIQVQKLPYTQIGKMYNCSCNNIKKVAKRLGIDLEIRRKVNESEASKKQTKTVKGTCLNCGCNLYRAKSKFCSNKCQFEYDYKTYIQRWKNGEEDGMSGKFGVSEHIRRYLFNKYNGSCQICGWNKTNPFSENVPLQIHHIDGNYKNNTEENLQLLCPNCHSLTETFGRLNKNGRKDRYK